MQLRKENLAASRADDVVPQSRWTIGREVSVEGVVAIMLAAVSAVYAFAFLTARVEVTEKELARQSAAAEQHAAEERQNSQQLDLRLQGIEQQLNRILGRLDGQRHDSK